MGSNSSTGVIEAVVDTSKQIDEPLQDTQKEQVNKLINRRF